jgi:hypothetical protein
VKPSKIISVAPIFNSDQPGVHIELLSVVTAVTLFIY